MFKFGCSTVIELEDAITFARIFGLKTDRPTLRRIARASAICYHRLVKSEDVCTFLVRSQNQPEKKYQVALSRQGWKCNCPDQEMPCKHIIACQWTLHCHQTTPPMLMQKSQPA